MDICRDELLRDSGEDIKFLDLRQEDVTVMANMCIESLAGTSRCLKARLTTLKSRGLFASQKEPKFLKELLA